MHMLLLLSELKYKYKNNLCNLPKTQYKQQLIRNSHLVVAVKNLCDYLCGEEARTCTKIIQRAVTTLLVQPKCHTPKLEKNMPK